MSSEAQLREIAEQLSRIVEYWGGQAGFSGEDLVAQWEPFAALDPREQFRALVLLARVPVIAAAGYRGNDEAGCGVSGWRFWLRCYAPAHAHGAWPR